VHLIEDYRNKADLKKTSITCSLSYVEFSFFKNKKNDMNVKQRLFGLGTSRIVEGKKRG
jgi:hypothetical protein